MLTCLVSPRAGRLEKICTTQLSSTSSLLREKNENCTFLIILGASEVLVVAVGNEYHNQIDGSILTNIIELHTEFHKLGHFILFLQNPF